MIYIKQKGFSIIEVLLACILASFLIAAAMQVYVSTKKLFLLQSAIAHLLEHIRFADYTLTNQIRMAGDASCVGINLNSLQELIRGYQNNLPNFLQNTGVKKDTDIIVVQQCRMLEGKVNLHRVAYFIANTNRKDSSTKPTYALYEKFSGSDRHELVPDVSEMQIRYGINESQKINNIVFLTADEIADWHQVKIIKIILLFNSSENILPRITSFSFQNKIITADRKLKKEIILYITLREPNG